MARPRSTLFPYTTLFRSLLDLPLAVEEGRRRLVEQNQIAGVRRDLGDQAAPGGRSEERFRRNGETEIYTLSLHDALPISSRSPARRRRRTTPTRGTEPDRRRASGPRRPGRARWQIGRAVQEEWRDRDLHSFPTRRSSDLFSISRSP